jgi:tetratricopeptide (TPR) repeat protein
VKNHIVGCKTNLILKILSLSIFYTFDFMRFVLLILTFFFFNATAVQVGAQSVSELETKLTAQTDTVRVNTLLKLSHLLATKDTTKAMGYAREALKLSQELKYYTGEAQAWRRFARVYYFSNNTAQFIHSLEVSTNIATEHTLWPIVAENHGNMAGGYATIQSNNTLALEYYLKAYDVYEKHMPNGAKYIPLLGIAVSYRNQAQYAKALEYIEQAIPLIDAAGDDRNKAIAYENSGQIYLKLKDLPKARESFQKALALFEKSDGIGGQIYSLVGLANVLRESDDLATAMTHGERALELCKNFATPDRARILGLESVGKTLLAQGKISNAKAYLEEGLAIALKLKAPESIRDFSEQLAKVSVKLHDYKRAFEYESQYKAYGDTVLNKEMANQLSEVRTRFETEKKEAEIELLKRDKQITQFYFATAVASMLGVIAFGYLIITRQRYKNKKDRELAAIQNQALTDKQALVEVELKNQQLEEAKLRDQLEFKNKELTTYTLNLIQKNESLENIKQQVDELRLLPDQQLRPKLAGLINTVNFSLNLDRDWENFKQHFEKVHQGFFDKLSKEYPDLTGNDLKLCALMKLNMDTKEIATIIDISPESVKVARHRLRKKMNLVTEQNLSSYLAGFGN